MLEGVYVWSVGGVCGNACVANGTGTTKLNSFYKLQIKSTFSMMWYMVTKFIGLQEAIQYWWFGNDSCNLIVHHFCHAIEGLFTHYSVSDLTI